MCVTANYRGTQAAKCHWRNPSLWQGNEETCQPKKFWIFARIGNIPDKDNASWHFPVYVCIQSTWTVQFPFMSQKSILVDWGVIAPCGIPCFNVICIIRASSDKGNPIHCAQILHLVSKSEGFDGGINIMRDVILCCSKHKKFYWKSLNYWEWCFDLLLGGTKLVLQLTNCL